MRPSSSPAVSPRSRTAASSMASGTPSRRRHSSAIAAVESASRAKSGAAARARSMNGRIASLVTSAPGSASAPAAGTDSGGTDRTTSPSMPSGWRLVARILSSGHARSSASARTAQASSRCSQLSSTSRASCDRRRSTIIATGQRPESSRRSSEAATDCATSAGRATPASSTRKATSVESAVASAVMALAARRLLPTPPGPVRVSRRPVARALRIRSSSRRRPTKLVSSPLSWERSAITAGAPKPEDPYRIRTSPDASPQSST